MKLKNLELFNDSVVDLTLDEQIQVIGGSGATWGAGWLIGRGIAAVGMLYAAGCVAINLAMMEGGGYGSGEMM
jgi:hypothetical protein